MMQWARLVRRTRWWWIVAWPAVAAGAWLNAPRIPTLLADDAHGSLPESRPSQAAFAHLREEFPEAAPASRAVIVLARSPALTPEDRAFAARVSQRLAAHAGEQAWTVRSAALASHLRALFQSRDGAAEIIAVDLPADMLTPSAVNRVQAVDRILAEHPAPGGLMVAVTGSAALGRLLDSNARRDVDVTTLWTFIGVTVILLLIYRSPVAMLLPLVTIALSLMVALGILGRAAAYGLPINGLVEMFTVVILVGAGVDYCLFLFARFREELSAGGDGEASAERGEAAGGAARLLAAAAGTNEASDITAAVERAVSRTGSAIIASTGTNASGLAILWLAQNRDLYTSGPTIAFALCIATVAVLTLAPALMVVVGRHLLWPAVLDRRRQRDSSVWAGIASLATRRPVAVAAALLAVMLPPAVLSGGIVPLYDSLQEFPPDSGLVRGARAYEKHFCESHTISDLTILISSEARLDSPESLPVLRRTLGEVRAALLALFPTAYVRHLADPLGEDPATPAASSPTASGSDDAAAPAGLGAALRGELLERLARDFYIGRSGRSVRVDAGLRMDGRSVPAMRRLPELHQTVEDAVIRSGLASVLKAPVRVELAGELPRYADLRGMRLQDFRVIAVAATVLIFLVLLALTRSPVYAAILIGASLLTYFATYGATWMIVRQVFGLPSVGYQLEFLLFIILLSLGQDYNIYVVTRIQEELGRSQPAEAVATAVRRTGRVVSSCGIIMAAAFASMFSGSLMLMKQFAIALVLGILVDTFVIRPLLVPAMILLVCRRGAARGAPAGSHAGAVVPAGATDEP